MQRAVPLRFAVIPDFCVCGEIEAPHKSRVIREVERSDFPNHKTSLSLPSEVLGMVFGGPEENHRGLGGGSGSWREPTTNQR